MKPIVPFVSEASQSERKEWRQTLPYALSGFAVVKPFEELSDTDRLAAKVAIVANPDPSKLAALPNLIWVQSLWAGVERLVTELPNEGPKIVRLTDPQMAETMSEAALAWTLYLHRDMPRYHKQQAKKVWQSHLLKTPSERRIGVLGLGKLGSATARRLQSNGFDVLGWSRSQKELDDITCLSGEDGLRRILAEADVAILLMPLTANTKGLMNEEKLQSMKKGASLINFARGPIVSEKALLKALDSGPLNHAVLDVFDQEPLPDTHPFWTHERITLLPHISAPTITSTACKIVAENIRTYFENGFIPPSVDREQGY